MKMVLPPNPNYIGPLPHTDGPTNKPIFRIVVHCTAGEEPVPGAARRTVHYTRTHPEVVSSYHYCADSEESVQAVWDSVVAYHCGFNGNSIGYELSCSLANEGRDHWKRDDHQKMLDIAVMDIAKLCLYYDVPIVKLSVAELSDGKHGICGHVDIREAFPGRTTHWDPGPHFPWPDFIRRVQRAADELTNDPKPEPKPDPRKFGVHLGLWGDWNESADSTGRWSPSWIAKKGGLGVFAPPPGKRGHTGIDYGLSSAPVTDVRRIVEDVSDHNPVMFTVTNPKNGRKLVGVSFNVMRDRTSPQRAELKEWLEDVGTREGVDFFALQECRQYHELLASVEGYAVVASKDPQGVEHNAILVRNGLELRNPEFKLTSKTGWVTVTGAHHDPSSVVLVTIDGWYRVGCVHEAPTVDWLSGKPVGPVNRIAARVTSAETLAGLAKWWKKHR